MFWVVLVVGQVTGLQGKMDIEFGLKEVSVVLIEIIKLNNAGPIRLSFQG